MSSKWEHTIVRDPLYGFVGLSKKEELLLDTPCMQRLSRIKQLAHTYIVYPSAVHTRLEHSLGVLFIAGRIAEQLELPQKQKRILRIAALLHDIGQGPFSHIFEEPMRWINGKEYTHEITTRLIVEHQPQIKKVLANLKEEIISVFQGGSLLSDIISSSLDADKLDYLRRDSHHIGVAYGLFDLERIIRTICKIAENGREYLAIHEKGKDALESYRLARYAMHSQVYEHHTRLIADDMFLKAVKLAFDEGCLLKEDYKISDPNNFVNNFLKLDDYSIQHKILQNSKGTAKKLIQAIQNRKLLKRAFYVPLTKEGVRDPIRRKKIIEMTREDIEKVEKKIAEELNIDPAYVIVHLQSIKIKLYERFEQTLGSKETPIYVKRRDGTIASFDEESPIFASLNPIRRLYLFCPKKYIPKARNIAENIFDVKSLI
ncbi:MAG: HD domain-containing protein [Candidatus Baldrarchaeia archaeon]